MKVLIVGAGLSGCVLAERFARKGHDVKVVEKRNHIAGNCYDYIDDNGILIGKYGPHLFHTNSDKVWNYIQQFCEWIPWRHKVYGRYKEKFFPIPINLTTVNTLYGTSLKSGDEMKEFLKLKQKQYTSIQNSEEYSLANFGEELYRAVIHGYTKKQWEKDPSELDPSVVARIPIRYSKEEGYFDDVYQALPEKGYTYFCHAMLAHPNIEVQLNYSYKKDENEKYDLVFFTGPIDAYFQEYNYEKLEYRSLRFEKETVDTEFFQENSQVNYTDESVPYTRIIEYKHLLHQKSERTTIVKEYPCKDGEPYYPVPTEKNKNLYEKYRELAFEEEKKGVYFVGRLANYKYFNMDQAILNALTLFESLQIDEDRNACKDSP
jgi:UDP-galactopyranose mutase